MKKFFNDWAIFEIILLVCNPIIVLIIGLIFKNDALTIITSAGGIIGVLLCAKGLPLGQIIGLIIAILYSIVSYLNRFYGEMIIYLVYMVPMYIYTIITWKRHKSKRTNTVEVSSIKWKEWVVVGVCSALVFVGIYFLLRALNTKELIISTLSIVDNIFAIYLLARRSKYGFVSYIVNDVILIILWGIPVIQGNLLLLAMLFNPIMNLISDIYAVVNWTKMQKQQQVELKN